LILAFDGGRLTQTTIAQAECLKQVENLVLRVRAYSTEKTEFAQGTLILVIRMFIVCESSDNEYVCLGPRLMCRLDGHVKVIAPKPSPV
jgi:hypothetical protein